MTSKGRGANYLRAIMIALALLLPSLSLIVLGSLWLWEKGYLLYWGAGALALTVGSYLYEAWLLRGPEGTAGSSTPARSSDQVADDPSWSPLEVEAWSAVEALAVASDPSQLTSRDAIVDLGIRTIEAVAKTMHPQDKTPLWRFTVPEALALMQRICSDLRPFVAHNIPLGDQLTVGQVLRIYRWRSVVDFAGQAYDLWRLVRLLNPVAAAASEARERLTRNVYLGVRDQLARRLTQGFVRQVGRAAIDLYSGRLKTSDDEADIIPPNQLNQRPAKSTWSKLWSQTKGAVRSTYRSLRS
jgi:uncharacterized protein